MKLKQEKDKTTNKALVNNSKTFSNFTKANYWAKKHPFS